MKNGKKEKAQIDVRELFDRGKASNNPVVRGATKVAEFLWDTPVILGGAVADIDVRKTEKTK